MTIVYPYSLDFFADKLKISSVVWDIQRNDEMSGVADGRIWAAELAPPLWIATLTLSKAYLNNSKQIAALIRKLHGSQQKFFLYDPMSQYPQADPQGLILGSAAPSVAANNGDTLSLKGLPAGYVLTLGDKIAVAYSGNPTRYAFLEVSETVAADGAGVTPAFGIFPSAPVGVVADLAATLIRPACQCVLFPGSHTPGTASGITVDGQTFKVIQKK